MVVGAAQVFYNVTNFIEKNRDTLSSDIMAALQVNQPTAYLNPHPSLTQRALGRRLCTFTPGDPIADTHSPPGPDPPLA